MEDADMNVITKCDYNLWTHFTGFSLLFFYWRHLSLPGLYKNISSEWQCSSKGNKKEICPESKQNGSISIIFSLLNLSPTVKMQHGGIFWPQASCWTGHIQRPADMLAWRTNDATKVHKNWENKQTNNKNIQKLQLKSTCMQGVKRKINIGHFCVKYLYNKSIFFGVQTKLKNKNTESFSNLCLKLIVI